MGAISVHVMLGVPRKHSYNTEFIILHLGLVEKMREAAGIWSCDKKKEPEPLYTFKY